MATKEQIETVILKRKWSFYLLELLVVFLGVTGAFALSEWSDSRRDASAEISALESIKVGLEKDLEDIEINIQAHEGGIQAIDSVMAWIGGQPAPDSMGFNMYLIFRDLISIQNSGPYDMLKSKGLDIIQNDSLRFQIIEVYDFQMEILEKLEEEYHSNQYHKNYYKTILEGIIDFIEFKPTGGEYISTKSMDKRTRKLLLVYLNDIKFNRMFTLSQYKETQLKIDNLINNLDAELKRL